MALSDVGTTEQTPTVSEPITTRTRIQPRRQAQEPDRATATRVSASHLLVSSPECPSAVVDAYHTLFTNVELAMGSASDRVLAVVAVDTAANAALVGANLALVGAESGDRTLLVDADMEAPALDALFGANPGPGLVQLLRGEQDDLRDLAQPTTLPTLGVIAAGGAAAGTRHHRLDRLGDLSAAVLRLKNAADRVVIVAAPVLSAPDAQRLAAYVDGMLLVITPGRTSRENAARARALLERAQAPLIGVAIVPKA